MHHRSCLLALAGLLCASLPAAAAPPVRLLAPAPADAATLRAGTLAEIAWEPLEAFERLEEAEEWEAFLSLDGGAHYTLRITPHLDGGLRRVLWRVPATPTNDARILLRFGDEHRETAVELPQRFAIAASPGSPLDLEPVRVSLRRGEPALPGQEGVVAWVEGDRHGGAARPVVAAEPPAAHAPPSIAPGHGEETVSEAAGSRHDAGAALAAARPLPGSLRRNASPAAERTAPAAPIPILLQTRRLNE
jgi:hypothetical protein